MLDAVLVADRTQKYQLSCCVSSSRVQMLLTCVVHIAGVSAQSFVQSFGLAQTAFNVQLASPQVHAYSSQCWSTLVLLITVCLAPKLPHKLCLWAFHSNCGSILYCFRDKARY